MTTRLSKPYLFTTVATMVVLPGVSILMGLNRGADVWLLIGKWFVFWAIGVRLTLAGVRQAAQPGFTAQEIFNLTGTESHVVVRELGFSNLCLGLTGIASLMLPTWRPAVAFCGGLYFGIAGMLHVVKGAATANERLALWSDLLLFVIVAVYLIRNIAIG